MKKYICQYCGKEIISEFPDYFCPHCKNTANVEDYKHAYDELKKTFKIHKSEASAAMGLIAQANDIYKKEKTILMFLNVLLISIVFILCFVLRIL